MDHDLDQLDNERMTRMKKAEDKCRKYKSGKVAFSPSVSALGAGIRFLTMALGWKQGRKTSSQKLEELQKKSELTGLTWKTSSIEYLSFLLNRRVKEYKSAKEQATDFRNKILYRLAEKK